jgi:hypothetical protein
LKKIVSRELLLSNAKILSPFHKAPIQMLQHFNLAGKPAVMSAGANAVSLTQGYVPYDNAYIYETQLHAVVRMMNYS